MEVEESLPSCATALQTHPCPDTLPSVCLLAQTRKTPRTPGPIRCSRSVGHPPRRRSALRASNASSRSPLADSREGSSSPRVSMGSGAPCRCPPTLSFPWVRRGHCCRDSELASERLVPLLGAVPTGGLWAPSLGPVEGGAAGGGAAGRGWAGGRRDAPKATGGHWRLCVLWSRN